MLLVRSTLVALALLAGAVPAFAQAVNRPPCRDVLSQVNKEVTAREGSPASPRAVARKMGTEPEWVRRCMESYGRVPSDRSRQSDADREAFERAFEEGRPIELGEEQDDLRWQKLEKQRLERAELRERQKKLRQQKEFEDSAESFDFPMAQY